MKEFILVFVFAGMPLSAQRVSIDAALQTSDKSYVKATGESTVVSKPDQAVIGIGVITQSNTAASAATQNATQTSGVLSDLKRVVSGGDNIRTTSYTVRPNYQRSKSGAPPTIANYTATNVVEITINDLTQVGKVIDAVLQSGANTIQRVQFGLKNPQAPRMQALREAAAQAKVSAEAIAAGAGVHILRVLSVEETLPSHDIVDYKRGPSLGLNSAAPETEVAPGNIETNIIVTLRVEVGP